MLRCNDNNPTIAAKEQNNMAKGYSLYINNDENSR